ncbi:MAG: ABC transporter permease [Candidatus Micrarchaeota archaeon]|nr:ABC transporter permease [Candidatus Micrarchaeota archaeon]
MASFVYYLNLALRTFRHKPTRSWLTVIGIFIGITALIALISVGQGLQETIDKQFSMLNPNALYIFPGSGFYGILAATVGSVQMTDHDIKVIQKVNGIEKVAGFAAVLAGIESGSEIKYAFLIGYEPSEISLREISSISIEKGRELQTSDGYKAVVGWLYANGDVFKKKLTVGDEITIKGKKFTIVGIAERVGSEEDDKQVYIPLSTMKEIYGDIGYMTIWATVKETYPIETVAERVKVALRKDRGLKEGEEDFTVQTPQQLYETYGAVISIVQIIVIGIAAISLVVGGIGIMNTMYTSVLERTREIGIMKAVGARNRDIMIIFLIESGILGLVGGALGIGAGILISKGIETITLQTGYPFGASTPLWLIIGALAFSFIVGSVSGLLPAMQAARMKPAESLRV